MEAKDKDLEELKLLRQRFEQHHREQVSGLSNPIYGTKTLINQRAIPKKFLDNFHARESGKDDGFVLDAELNRGDHRNRQYSARDVLALSGVMNLTANGAPMPVAKRTAKMMVDALLNGRPVVASVRNTKAYVVVFRRASDWVVAPIASSFESAEDGGQSVRAYVFSVDGVWREERLLLKDVPPLRMVLDVYEFSRRVLADLGLTIIFGTADDIRQVTDRAL